MQYLQEDLKELKTLCDFVNQSNDALPPLLLQGLRDLQAAPTRIELDSGLFIPTTVEAIRILRNLRQRFNPEDVDKPLISQIRVEVRPRKRPERNISTTELQSTLREIALIGNRRTFSRFQIKGWEQVSQVLNWNQANQAIALVITAPTGAGKTEVFLLPIIRQIAAALLFNKKENDIPRFAIIYPRTALAQDQIIRTFLYVERAQQLSSSKGKIPFIVGLQFFGIRAKTTQTLNDSKTFRQNRNDYEFLLLDNCPWCKKNTHLRFESKYDYTYLVCPLCRKQICVSLSREDHKKMKPHLMLTTAESLDSMYLDWDFRSYLPLLQGIVLDEAHIFNQIHGAHIHHLLKRIRRLIKDNSSRELKFIASSATISDAENFAQRLFFGNNSLNSKIEVISAEDHPQVLTGLETLYFLQAQEKRGRSQALSAMIQAIMAMGHGILKGDRRMIVFAESLDIAGRLQTQLYDAEIDNVLWDMRVDLTGPRFRFNGHTCPHTSPLSCPDIYMKGECWRGAIGGCQCHNQALRIRNNPLSIQIITGNTQGQKSFKEPIIIGTSALEVGIDDSTVQTTLHYRPPRTVFDFIQRRGRSGRDEGDSAYTVVVLGDEPSDYYYLTRRHRLIEGDYELPLNPNNPVIEEIHLWLEKARKEAFEMMQRCGGKQAGAWKWMLSKFSSCPIIQQKYGPKVNLITQCTDFKERAQILGTWIEEGKKEAKDEVGIEWELPNRKQQISTPELLAVMDNLVTFFKKWLNQEIDNEEFTKEIDKIMEHMTVLFSQSLQTSSPSAASFTKEFQIVHQSLIEAKRSVMNRTLSPIGVTSGKAWFDFFSTLEKLFENNYNLFILGNTVRIVYQALYSLHRGLTTHHCDSNIPVYVPDNYFGGIIPIRVELPGGQMANEPITFLSDLFAPYRVSYRYDKQSLYTLETYTRKKIQTNQVSLRPAADGPQNKDPEGRAVIQAKSIQLRKLQTNARQAIGFCRSCMQLYDLERQNTTCRCSGQIQAGTIFLKKRYTSTGFQGTDPVPVSPTFATIPSLKAWTTLYGTQVSFTPQDKSLRELTFKAWLDPALYYELPTKGIQWKIPGQLNKDQLCTAANLLHKTMASIVGVREDKLAHSYDERENIVQVWETSEGGVGLIEVFAGTLQKNPLKIYLEMVATAACPIYLAEQYSKFWKNQTELVLYLANEFKLSQGEALLEEIAVEAQAEGVYREGLVCEKYDGCPACIQSSQMAENEQPKRSLAWQLVQSLIHVIPDAQWTDPMNTVIGPDIWFDKHRGLHHVLVL